VINPQYKSTFWAAHSSRIFWTPKVPIVFSISTCQKSKDNSSPSTGVNTKPREADVDSSG
jgi:hypothetical protein